MKLLAIALLTTLTACAGPNGIFGSGNAGYTYSHINADGSSCVASVDSTRMLAGVTLAMSKDCQLKISIDKTTADAETTRLMGKLVDKIPGP
jgi:hypothetical protein